MASILVIDDDPGIRTLLRHLLEQAQHTVFEAANGKEGLRMVRDTPVALIITDILMPEQDGLEVIQEMSRNNPVVKIIALSGGGTYLGVEILDTATDFGAVATFAKPFDIGQLLEVVERALL